MEKPSDIQRDSCFGSLKSYWRGKREVKCGKKKIRRSNMSQLTRSLDYNMEWEEDGKENKRKVDKKQTKQNKKNSISWKQNNIYGALNLNWREKHEKIFGTGCGMEWRWGDASERDSGGGWGRGERMWGSSNNATTPLMDCYIINYALH